MLMISDTFLNWDIYSQKMGKRILDGAFKYWRFAEQNS